MFDAGTQTMPACVGSAIRKKRRLAPGGDPPEFWLYEDTMHLRSSSRTQRKPMLSFRSSASFLLRFDTRSLLGLLFQEPPRITSDGTPLHQRKLRK
jgi:hypothetical protein